MKCTVIITEGERPTAEQAREIENCFQAELQPLQEELARVHAQKEIFFELKDGIYEQIIEVLPDEIHLAEQIEALKNAYRAKYSPHILF